MEESIGYIYKNKNKNDKLVAIDKKRLYVSFVLYEIIEDWRNLNDTEENSLLRGRKNHIKKKKGN